MITDYGNVILENEYAEIHLSPNINVLSMQNGMIGLADSDNGIGTALCLFNITKDQIEVIPVTAKIKINGLALCEPFANVSEGDVLTIDGFTYNVTFVPNSFDHLNKIIDFYLDGVLPEFIDIKNIFSQYAEQISLTDKQAALIFASIDIPDLYEE